MAGAALVSAVAIVAATPAFAPGDISVAMPSTHALSTAKYELTTLEALLALTPLDYQNAYFLGWGGAIPADNPYFPYSATDFPDGLSSAPQIPGVVYLVLDTLIHGTVNAEGGIDYYSGYGPLNYLYEIGTSAAIQVALQETIGQINPAISAAITTFFNIPSTINALIYTAATALPEIAIGPVTIGGGILAGLYYYGVTPDGSFEAASTGIPAILDYITNSIAGAVSTAAVPVAAKKVAAAEVTTLDAPATDDTTTTDATTTDATTTDTTTTDTTEDAPKPTRVRHMGATKSTSTEVAPTVDAVKPADSTDTPTTGTEDTTTTTDTPSATPKAGDDSSDSTTAPKKRENKRAKHSASSDGGSDSGS